jgi:uncharacterized protein (TIGR00730 family)
VGRDELTPADPYEGVGWDGGTEFERHEGISGEITTGFMALHDLEPAVAFFGSARSQQDSAEYKLAREVSCAVARQGFNIITGGGPGVMEAANRGCKEGDGVSVGLNILLPHGQHRNPYVDVECSFRYFLVRKLMLVKYSCAFLVFPGGYGTLDQTFEALTLVQTHKVPHFPILLFGGGFWRGIHEQLDRMVQAGFVSDSERDQVKLVSTADEAVEILRCCHEGLCADQHKPPLRPR